MPPAEHRSPAHAVVVFLAALVAALACAAPAAAAKAPRDFFGASAVQPSDRDFAGMRQLGLGSARIELSWRLIQKRRGAGNFNWNSADTRFRQAARNGLRVLPVLFGTPEFIKREPGKIRPPVRTRGNRLEWRRFVRAAAFRYRPGGPFWQQNPELNGSQAPTHWIVWNEQNAKAFWQPRVRPREYATLVRLSHRAVRDLDPVPKLVAGGMYGYPRHSRSMRMTRFLKGLYRRPGVKAALSGISLHPYASGLSGVRRQVKGARRILNRFGRRRAGIFIGEIGWASAGPSDNFLVKDRRRQARLLRRANRLFLDKRRRWRIKSSLWFVWRNYGRDANCPWCSKAGLLKKDFTRKPAYRAYGNLIERRVRG